MILPKMVLLNCKEENHVGIYYSNDSFYGPISHTSTQYIDFVDFFTFQWICLPIISLILVGVELPLRVVVTILECCVTFSEVKLSIRSFVLFLAFQNQRANQYIACEYL